MISNSPNVSGAMIDGREVAEGLKANRTLTSLDLYSEWQYHSGTRLITYSLHADNSSLGPSGVRFCEEYLINNWGGVRISPVARVDHWVRTQERLLQPSGEADAVLIEV